MLTDILAVIGDSVAWLIGVPLVVFMILYSTRSPWRADPLGIERMVQKLYLFLLWLVIMAGAFLPDELDWFKAIARLVVFTAITIVLSLQVINLWRVQNDSDRPLFFTWLTYSARAKSRHKDRPRAGA